MPNYANTFSVTITTTNYSDSISGMASNVVTRSNAQLPTSGVCPTSGYTGATTVTSPDIGVTNDNCYEYTLTGTANDGSSASVTSSPVLVDTTAPTVTGTVIGQSSGAVVNGFVKKNTGYYVYANATDTVSGVSTVTASVANVTTGQTAVPLSSTGGPFTAPGGGSYTYRSAQLTSNASQSDGAVNYTVNATDNAGNTSSYSNNGSVTFDSTAPTGGAISVPAYVKTLSVTITSTNYGDSGSGIASNVITRSAGQAPSSGLCPASGYTGATTVTSPDTGIANGLCYVYTLTGTDNLGNTANVTSSPVLADTTAPTVIVTYPVASTTYGANWTGTITGTAGDAASGVASTVVAVEDTTAGTWWNGTSFAASSQTFVATGGTPAAWTLALAAGNLSSGHTYTVTAKATDGAGNVTTSSTVTFTYNTTPPSLSITNPTSAIYNSANDTWQTSWANPSGSSSSSLGIQGVQYTLQAPSGEYWNGSAWQSGTVSNATTGTTAWSVTFPNTNFALTGGGSGTYTLSVTATDNVGNTTTTPVTFYVDYNPSNTVFVSPSGSNSNSGLTSSAPKLTVAAALTAAASAGRTVIAVAAASRRIHIRRREPRHHQHQQRCEHRGRMEHEHLAAHDHVDLRGHHHRQPDRRRNHRRQQRHTAAAHRPGSRYE